MKGLWLGTSPVHSLAFLHFYDKMRYEIMSCNRTYYLHQNGPRNMRGYLIRRSYPPSAGVCSSCCFTPPLSLRFISWKVYKQLPRGSNGGVRALGHKTMPIIRLSLRHYHLKTHPTETNAPLITLAAGDLEQPS